MNEEKTGKCLRQVDISVVICDYSRQVSCSFIYLLFIGSYFSYISWVMYWSGYTCRILAGWCPLYTLYMTLSKYDDIYIYIYCSLSVGGIIFNFIPDTIIFKVQEFLCSENDTLSLFWLLFLSTMNWNEFQVTVLYIWSNLNFIDVLNKLLYVSFQILNVALNVSPIVGDVIFKSCGQRTYIELNVAFVQIIY